MKVSLEGRPDFRAVLSPTPGNALPKRGAFLPVILNGTPLNAVVTNNRAWSASSAYALEYIFFPLNGKAYYITLNYAEKAEDLRGAEFTIAEGVASRPDPKRVTEATEREERRKDEALKTYRKNRETDPTPIPN
jgi:hypothetical protein